MKSIQLPFLTISRSTLSLLLITLLSIALLVIRAVFAQYLMGIFLVWNLFLAWLPLIFILLARRLLNSKHRFKQFGILSCVCLWLLFFPNSPYIVTDLMHLNHLGGHLLWFDSIGLFVVAFAGLTVGIYSLFVAHQVVSAYTPFKVAWFFIGFSTFLAGFGLYLGRFVRFNSWDLFTNPVFLLKRSVLELQNPLAIQMTLVFTLVLFILYLSFWVLFSPLTKKFERNEYL